MKYLDPYDRLLQIPPDVIRAAVLVRQWVAANLGDMKDVRIAGVGVRTFLCVEEMLRERVPEIRISELKDNQ